jgi:plasmid stabilization system protein ParE
MDKEAAEIIWHREANKNFKKIIDYLSEESVSTAQIVSNAILEEIGKLALNPNSKPPDRFKKNNDGIFRAFQVYSYRISYYTDEKIIYVLRIRHVNREPLEF